MPETERVIPELRSERRSKWRIPGGDRAALGFGCWLNGIDGAAVQYQPTVVYTQAWKYGR